MHEDLISVILPIYKVENYLKKCIDSVINQTYTKLEIILVDDGSPDKCGDICNEYSKKDARIKVIHKENGGLSDARNAGIKGATGKYIAFIDPDDYVDSNYIKILYENIISTNSDISICFFKEVSEDENILNKETIINNVTSFNMLETFNNLYVDKYALNTVVAWNKLYKIELWKDIVYPKGKIHEDEFVIHKLIQKCNKVVYTGAVLYYYVQHKNSITGIGYNEKTFDGFEAIEQRAEFFLKNGYEDLYEKCLYSLCLSNRMVYISTNNKNLKSKLNKQFKYISRNFIRGNFNYKRKIKILILKCFPIILEVKRRKQ